MERRETRRTGIRTELMGTRRMSRWSPRMSTTTTTILFLFTSLAVTQAHVVLTFPPARNFDLDFLDSARTKAPCGMPKGTERTPLKAGSRINITWHLAYPHMGGFRLEVLDPKERRIRDLTPNQEGQRFITGDPTAQSYVVNLPEDLEC